VTRNEAITLLPCYISGDLPAEVLAQVSTLVASDPELGDLVEQLRNQQERVVASICDGRVPAGLEAAWRMEEAPPQAPESPRAAAGRGPFVLTLTALAAAALLVVFLLRGLGPSPQAIATVPSVVYTHEIALDGQLTPYDPSSLDTVLAAFEAAKLPDQLHKVPDLSRLGLTATAAYVIPGQPPGSAVAYTDGTTDYLCQMWKGLGLPRNSTSERTAGGVAIHGYQAEGVAVVMWEEHGLLCVMSASVALDTLMGLAQRRLTT
jgi:anti-sigma factor RsiW